MELLPNSHKAKEQEKRVKPEKVIKGKVRTKKKSELTKFIDSFISEDLPDIKHYILFDVLMPSIKKAVVDMVTDGVNMLLYGEVRAKKRSGLSDIPSYRSYSKESKYREDRSRVRRCEYDDFTVDTKEEALSVFKTMDEIIDRYSHVTIADLYDILGKVAPHTAENYGWNDVSRADTVKIRNEDGEWVWLLKFPRAHLIIDD